MHKRPTD